MPAGAQVAQSRLGNAHSSPGVPSAFKANFWTSRLLGWRGKKPPVNTKAPRKVQGSVEQAQQSTSGRKRVRGRAYCVCA